MLFPDLNTATCRTQPGTFIVRKSGKDGSFVLSMSGSGQVYNFKILERSGFFHILDEKNTNPPSFSNLEDLIRHFKVFDPERKGGLPARLTSVLPYRS